MSTSSTTARDRSTSQRTAASSRSRTSELLTSTRPCSTSYARSQTSTGTGLCGLRRWYDRHHRGSRCRAGEPPADNQRSLSGSVAIPAPMLTRWIARVTAGRCVPDCPVGIRTAATVARLVTGTVLVVVVGCGGFSIAWMAWRCRLLSEPSAALLTLATMLVGAYLCGRRWMHGLPETDWRSLGPGDLLSAVLFVPACALAWYALLAPAVEARFLGVVTITATLLHVIGLYGAILRLPHAAASLLGPLKRRLCTAELRKEYESRRHAVICLERRGARRSAAVRRAALARRSPSPEMLTIRAALRWTVESYSNTSLWLSAVLASAGLFPAMAAAAPPVISSALFVCAPLGLVPFFAAFHRRVHRSDQVSAPTPGDDQDDPRPSDERHRRALHLGPPSMPRHVQPGAPRVTTSRLGQRRREDCRMSVSRRSALRRSTRCPT